MMTKYTLILGASLLVSLALATANCHAETHQKSQSQVVAAVAPVSSGPKHSLLGHKLTSVGQPKARSARSLSDMFERVKSRIFGSKKQSSSSASNQATSSVAAAASSPVQSSISSSSQAAQRQPWDLNAFNQQFNPYASLSNGVYQWPSGSSINSQFMSPQFLGAQPTGMISSLDAISSSASSPATSSSNFNVNGIAQQSTGGANQANGQAGGLLSSASHLIAQYLSPTGSSSGSGSSSSGNQQFNQQQQQQSTQQQMAGASLTPQQQQQQSTYQDFANILDGLVAQTTGGSSNSNNKFMQQQQQQQPGQTLQQSGASYPPSSMSGAIGSGQPGDTEMAGSSNIQSYIPSAGGASVATPQQASQKSSMVGLAEQLAPGAQFNKLISFPFSLSSNDDQTKEGRYKLHIPFLNQHVKRSDDQAAQQQRAKSQQQQQQQQQQQLLQQQQMQQYLSSLYQQQQQQQAQQQQPQQYVSQYGQPMSQSQQQSQQQSQLIAQPSQVVPTIVSPQAAPSAASGSPVSTSQSVSTSVVSSSSAVSQSQPSASASVGSSNQSPSSSSSSSAASSPSNSASATNQRPSWSVSDTQSSASVSSNKLIPMQTASAAAAAALDSSDESVAQS